MRAGPLAALVCVAAFVCSCGATDGAYHPRDLKVQRVLAAPASAETAPSATPVVMDFETDGPHLVACSLNIVEGTAALELRGADAGTVASRLVDMPGASLVVLVAPKGVRRASLMVMRPANTGSLTGTLDSVIVVPVTPSTASGEAARLAAEFEQRTGRLADPWSSNLVPNAGFAADDEVRGTPADWFAYVTTERNVERASLRVMGAPPPGRPYLATGPIPVSPGRSYRFSTTVTVRSGGVLVSVVDYEEVATVAEMPDPFRTEPRQMVTVDFTASASLRAIRIQFKPLEPATGADFDVEAIHLQLLAES